MLLFVGLQHEDGIAVECCPFIVFGLGIVVGLLGLGGRLFGQLCLQAVEVGGLELRRGLGISIVWLFLNFGF
jgi:hypothetical protein